MKKQNQVLIVSLIIISVSLLFTVGCKKDKNSDPSTFTDVEGNAFHFVKIGKQIWMKENLKTTKFSNGDLIGTTNPPTFDISEESNPKYQWAYDGNEDNVAAYGRLYTWYAITDSRNICPAGWHLPTNAEWDTLSFYLEGENVAGGKLKEIGNKHWKSQNFGATDEVGFTALPGGGHDSNGKFSHLGDRGGRGIPQKMIQ